MFPQKGKNLDRPPNPNLIPINTDEFNERLGKPQMEQLVKEVNEDLNEREVHINHQITQMTTPEVDRDHQKT